MKKQLLALFLCAATYGFSQSNLRLKALGNAIENLVDGDVKILNEHTAATQGNKKLIGTPYLEDTFAPGAVYYKGQPAMEGNLRYNVYAEAFELQTLSLNPDDVSVVQKNSDISVLMNGKHYVYKFYVVAESQQFGYFEVIKDFENVTLMRKHRKLLQEGKSAVTSYDVARPGRLVSKEGLFVLLGDRKVLELKSSKGYLIKLFKEQGIEIKDFIKSNGLKMSSDDDFATLMGFVDKELATAAP